MCLPKFACNVGTTPTQPSVSMLGAAADRRRRVRGVVRKDLHRGRRRRAWGIADLRAPTASEIADSQNDPEELLSKVKGDTHVRYRRQAFFWQKTFLTQMFE